MSTEPTAPRGRLLHEGRVAVPEGVRFALEGRTVVASGPLGAIRRPFPIDALGLETVGREVVLTLQLPARRRRSQALLHAWERHLANLAVGVTNGFVARLKAVAAHFPMKVFVRDRSLVIENFLGEKYPRSAPLLEGVQATVDGDIVTLNGIDIEQVGQCAATIERATRIRDYDPRVFQDGIYIVEKARSKEAG